MNKYLVLYRAPVPAEDQMANATPEQRKAGMDAWNAWAAKAGSALVDFGAPLGPSATLGGKPQSDFVGGYSIIQADSLAHAEKLLEGHPHLDQPGFSIDVLEQLPMPGM